jgi:hypothetical protein
VTRKGKGKRGRKVIKERREGKKGERRGKERNL